MKNNPQVAIMMPVYNGERTLPLAIKSLQAQTYQNWKCYIVNDGSTDNTKNILDAIKDDRFVVHHFSENKGRPYARQEALDLAEGKYIAFLDADDFFHPEKLEKQVNVLESNPKLGLVSCAMVSYDAELNFISIRADFAVKEELYKIGKEYRFPRTPAMVYLERAKKIEYNFKLKYAQDTDFFMKYADNKYCANIEEPLYFYSEYESVTKEKILKTNYYGIILFSSFFYQSPFHVTKKIVKNLFKIGGKIIIYPFVDANFYLNKRGANLTEKQQTDFKNILEGILKP
ncbi:glycosyltransferase family 2 protein [Empedobacter falsenii]